MVYVDSQGKRCERRRAPGRLRQWRDEFGDSRHLIFNQNIKDNAGFIDSQLADGMAANRIIKADTLEERWRC